MGKPKNRRLKLYPAGSFLGFRDKLIKSLKNIYSIGDARSNSQYSSAATVMDDMNAVKKSEITLTYVSGMMTYAETGASLVYGNLQITVDENEKHDPLIKKLTPEEHYFTFLDNAIYYLASNPIIQLSKKQPVLEKYPKGARNPIPMQTIYICGTIDDQIREIVEEAKKRRPDKNYILRTDDYLDFKAIEDYDLVVANFPLGRDRDKHACLMLGAAFVHKISTLVIDPSGIKYSPIEALARRQMSPEMMLRYITEVDDLHISKESRVMYSLFEEEQEKHL